MAYFLKDVREVMWMEMNKRGQNGQFLGGRINEQVQLDGVAGSFSSLSERIKNVF